MYDRNPVGPASKPVGGNFMKDWRVLCVPVFLLVLVLPAAFAQVATAGLQGTAKDPRDSGIAGAIIEVTSSALHGTRTVRTDSSGYYQLMDLPPGDYDVTVRAQGFRTLKKTNVKLHAGELTTINMKLKVEAFIARNGREVRPHDRHAVTAHSKCVLCHPPVFSRKLPEIE
jgi:hypothetical protein